MVSDIRSQFDSDSKGDYGASEYTDLSMYSIGVTPGRDDFNDL